jgi:hypothetical protein
VRSLRRNLADGRDATEARAVTLDAVRAVGRAWAAGLGTWGVVVVSQVDNAAANLLCAAGLADRAAKAQVRQASVRERG